MGGVIRTQALGGSGVILVIKGLLLELVHVLNQVIGRLVGYIGEFLVKQVVLRDGMFDRRLLKLYYVNLKDTSADSTDTNGPNPTC